MRLRLGYATPFHCLFISLYLQVLQLSLAGGIMRSLNAFKDIPISERFLLGGPTSLRGFSLQGVGPHMNGRFLAHLSDCFKARYCNPFFVHCTFDLNFSKTSNPMKMT